MSIRGNPLFRARTVKSSLELRVMSSLLNSEKLMTRVYLLAPGSAGERLAEQHRIDFNKHGAYFLLDADVDLSRFPSGLLPFYARPQLAPFMNDTPPANSWGGSLGVLLTSSSLKPAAEAAATKFAGKCYLCGTPDLSPQGPAHHARPWWGYAEPSNGESFGRQHLLALTPMCRDCADTLQLPRATDQSRLESTLARLAAAFRFTDAEASQYRELVEKRWSVNSSHFWAVDLSREFGGATVELQAAWQHSADSNQEQSILFRAASGNGPSASLQLRGVKYLVHGNHRVSYFR